REPVEISRGGILGRLALALLDRGRPDGRGGDVRPDVEWLRARRALAERRDDLLRAIAVHRADIGEHLLFRHALAVGTVDVRDELVEIRADDHRHIRGERRRDWVEWMLRNGPSIEDRPPAQPLGGAAKIQPAARLARENLLAGGHEL